MVYFHQGDFLMAKTKTFPFGPSEEAKAYHISLHCIEGGSDKIYELSIEPVGEDRFSVTYANGKRGSKLVGGSKTPNGLPVGYDEAKKIVEQVLAQKIKGGYNPINSLSGHLDISKVSNSRLRDGDTGLRFKELIACNGDDHVKEMIESLDYLAQEKFNGERRPIIFDTRISDKPFGTNRNGIMVELPENIASAFAYIGNKFVIDGEIMGDRYVMYDILQIDENDLRDEICLNRIELMQEFYKNSIIPAAKNKFEIAYTAVFPEQKLNLYNKVKTKNGEGLVFKTVFGKYMAVRDQNQIKAKFWNSLSAVVTGLNQNKRSVGLCLFEDGKRVDVGNVTVPSNMDIPEAGSVVEVIYLHAMPNGGLISPTLERVRNDVLPTECTTDQRVMKPEGQENVAEPGI
jgi:bifunctional non-homologous end joining protein LigD